MFFKIYTVVLWSWNLMNTNFDPQLVLTSNELILCLIKESILYQMRHNNLTFMIYLTSIDMIELMKLTDNKRNK